MSRVQFSWVELCESCYLLTERIVSICYLCFKCKRVVCILLCSWLLVNVNTYHNCSHLHEFFFISVFLFLFLLFLFCRLFLRSIVTYEMHAPKIFSLSFSVFVCVFACCRCCFTFLCCNCVVLYFCTLLVNRNAINNNQITVNTKQRCVSLIWRVSMDKIVHHLNDVIWKRAIFYVNEKKSLSIKSTMLRYTIPHVQHSCHICCPFVEFFSFSTLQMFSRKLGDHISMTVVWCVFLFIIFLFSLQSVCIA